MVACKPLIERIRIDSPTSSNIMPISHMYIIDEIKKNLCFEERKKSNYSNYNFLNSIFSDELKTDIIANENSIIKEWFNPKLNKNREIEHSSLLKITILEFLSIKKLESSLDEKIKDCSVDEVLFFLFDSIDDILTKKEFKLINFFFEEINPNKYNTEILICLLSASFPWKKIIYKRDSFYKKIETTIHKRYPEMKAKALLAGLE